MKKLCFIIVALSLMVLNSLGAVTGGGNFDIPLSLVWNDPSNTNTPVPKTPIPPLLISQDGNVLTLPATPVDYMLELRDENGILVYYTFIPQGTTQIVLPSTLSGDFEIRLVADTYYYIGYLSL